MLIASSHNNVNSQLNANLTMPNEPHGLGNAVEVAHPMLTFVVLLEISNLKGV